MTSTHWYRTYGISKERDKLTIQYPGIYFIYSQVTFSRNSPLSSLKQSIRSTVPKKHQGKELLKSFCSLKPNTQNLCTASVVGVFHLEKDQQLYVTVTNTSLVNRDSCNFGLFKLAVKNTLELKRLVPECTHISLLVTYSLYNRVCDK